AVSGLVTRYVQTTKAPISSLTGWFGSSASSSAVGASGLAALTAFLTTIPWVVPTWYAGSRALTVPDGPVAYTVAKCLYPPAWAVAAGTNWPVEMNLAPTEVNNQVSPGSKLPSRSVSPVMNPPASTGAGVKSSVGSVGVPLSSRREVIVSSDSPVFVTR